MNLRNFKDGWIVGDFTPSLFENKEVEIGILKLPRGHKGDGHYHLKHIEYNMVISGLAEVDGKLFSDGDVFIYKPNERSNVEFLYDTTLLVIKTPATKGDKYYE